MRTIRIATRASALAMIQTKAVADAIERKGRRVEVVRITTSGDQEIAQSLWSIGGDGIFVKELMNALLDERADIAVHSMKDLPTQTPPELCFGAVLVREDPRDVLISPRNAYADMRELPSGAVVGTSSLRRRALLLTARPDVSPRDLRGNVDTRVRKVLDGQYEAAILALAGMKRIGLLDAVGGGSPLALDDMVPAAGQGAICAQCRANDDETRGLLAPLHHPMTALETSLERAFLRRLGAGCLAPVGASAVIDGGSIEFRGVIVAADGTAAVRKTARGTAQTEAAAATFGEALADEMLAAGGRELVDAFRAAPVRTRQS